MPGVMKLGRAEAEAKIRQAGVTGRIEVMMNDGALSTEVCRQSPSETGQTMSHFTVNLEMCRPEEAPHEQPVLAGLSTEAATARAKAAGFTGTIEVHYLDEYDGSCKANTVCRVTPYRWEIDQDRTMELWVNKNRTISAPD